MNKRDGKSAHYRVYFTDAPLVNNGPLTKFLQVKAENAERAAQIVKVITGCECVVDIVRLDDTDGESSEEQS
ncbi:hypothetical protein [Burkholderia ubonensis]|uniref:hypothetical protein n=1 Tax=Burkholderia ubonensis TaxID=101571 RepID=UPI000B0FE62F|nr:hypothetical protein [Burkholderia ubonensis]